MNVTIHPHEILEYGQEFYYNGKLVTLIPLSDTAFKYSLDPREADNYFGVSWKSAYSQHVVWKAYRKVSDITNIIISQIPQQVFESDVNFCTVYVTVKRRDLDIY